jgi:hypothetical protein
MARLGVVLGLLLGLCSALLAANERLALDTQTPYQLAELGSPGWQNADELLLSGRNPHGRPITLVLRLDDQQSDAYPSRFNREWRLPPGDFLLALPLRGLRSGDGRLLNRSQLRRLYVFVEDGAEPLQLTALELNSVELPSNVLAWDFGAVDSPCQAGFRCVGPGDPSLTGVALEARQRPYSDALLAGGIRGIEQLRLPLAAGRWRLRLWREDPGEWEYLAHAGRRQIRHGPNVLLDEQRNGQQWYAQRYLAGRQREWQPGSTAWDNFGQWRGEAVEFEVTVAADGLTLNLDGDGSDARYLAGLLAWPLDAGAAQAQGAVARLDAYRAQRFNQAWSVSAPVLPAASPSLRLQRTALDHWLAPSATLAPLQSAAGGQVHLALRIDAQQDDPAPVLLIQPPQLDNQRLPLEVRFGHWRLQRPQASASLLEAEAGQLRADLSGLQLQAGLPRRLLLSLRIPADARPGRYAGQVQLASHGEFALYNFSVEVLASALPPLSQGVGLYHENLPVAGWFSELGPAVAAQQQCDWQSLRGLGMNRIAAGLATPTNDIELLNLLAQVRGLQDIGFSGPQLAYAPLKRLRAGLGDDASLTQLGRAAAALQKAQLPPLWWALADEPPRESLPDLLAYAARVHQLGPLAVAAQLNHPEQALLLPQVDVALVNAGFGADRADIQGLQAAGKQAWLYNLGHERLAAGFYLWRSGANGLLQWHARMPTADPFDPTDGREADFNYLWPEPLRSDLTSPCVAQDIDARLLQLSQGVEDLRWLGWLDQQAATNADAAQLRRQLLAQVPSEWAAAQQLDESTLDGWRAAMLQLASAAAAAPAAPAASH